jgi:large subunit ribosomal protein L29
MKAKELKTREIKELGSNLLERKEKLRQLRFDIVAGQVDDMKEIKKVKKEIAQILTIIREKKNDTSR